MYRWPKQTQKFNKLFYQLNYIKQAEPIQLPAVQEVKELLKTNFENHNTALGVKLNAVKQVRSSGRLLVFGANWGYEVAQFAKAGYEAMGYEVSAPRASFASEHLHIPVFAEIEPIRKKRPYDLIYTSHTLEHLPKPQIALSLFEELCSEKGFLVIFVPNCGGENARKMGVRWGPFSSSLHPLSYSARFFQNALPKYGFESVSTFSDPYDLGRIKALSGQSECPGDELLVIARKK